MKRRTVGFTAVMVAAAALASSEVPGRAYAPGNPAVVSDKQAALDVYGTITPPGGNQSTVQPNTQIEPSIAVNPGDHNEW